MPYVGSGDRLQPVVEERRLLLPVLAVRVDGDVAHRPRPVEGDEGDQVLELGRPDRAAAPRACPTTRTGRRRSTRRGRASRTSSGRRAGSSRCRCRRRGRRPCRSRRGCAGRGSPSSGARAPRRPSIANWVTTSWSAPFCWSGRYSVSGSVADDDAGGVDRVLADEPLERPREVDDLLRTTGSAS